MLRTVWSEDRNSWCVCDEDITGITYKVIDSGYATKEAADKSLAKLGSKITNSFLDAFQNSKTLTN